MRVASGMDTVTRKKVKNGPKKLGSPQETIGKSLPEAELDQAIKSDPEDNKRRRSILIQKLNGSWGFTIQTYGIHHKRQNELEFLTYVDYVDRSGPAYLAGLRSGDVILAVNGTSMEHAQHSTLVNFIKKCDKKIRMVVLFEDCCHKVELHSRYIKLKRVLQAKLFEHRSLEQQERMILEGPNLLDRRRLSLSSDSSGPSPYPGEDRRSLRPELDLCSGPLLAAADRSAEYSTRSLDTHRIAPPDGQDVGRDGGLSRAARPASLKLKRPISSYDLKFPAIAEFDSRSPDGDGGGGGGGDGLQRNVSCLSSYDCRQADACAADDFVTLSALSTRTSRILLRPVAPGGGGGGRATNGGRAPLKRNQSASELTNAKLAANLASRKCASTSTLAAAARGQQQQQAERTAFGFARCPVYSSTPLKASGWRPPLQRATSHAGDDVKAVLVSVKRLSSTSSVFDDDDDDDDVDDDGAGDNGGLFGFSNWGRYSQNWGRQLPASAGETGAAGTPVDDAGIHFSVDAAAAATFPSPVACIPPSPLVRNASPCARAGLGVLSDGVSSASLSPRVQAKLGSNGSGGKSPATNLRLSRSFHNGDSSDYYSLTPPSGKRQNAEMYRFFPDRVYAFDGSLIDYHGTVNSGEARNVSVDKKTVANGGACLVNQNNEETFL